MKLFRSSPVEGRMEPETLMLRVKRGDQAAFRILYDRFKGPILHFLSGMVGREALAEELAHEVFLRLYRTRESYEQKARFTTWLWTIARNAALDELRRKGELLAKFDAEEAGAPNMATDPDDGAEAMLVEAARREQVESCLAALPARQREAVMLRVAGEHSYEEIAGLMRESLPNVKNLLHRAKAALASCLKGR